MLHLLHHKILMTAQLCIPDLIISYLVMNEQVNLCSFLIHDVMPKYPKLVLLGLMIWILL